MNHFFWTAISITTLLVAALVDATAVSSMDYNDYISLVIQQQQEQQQQLRRSRRAQPSHCSAVGLNVTVENGDGCVGFVAVYGCTGRCRSHQIPHYYMSRYSSMLALYLIRAVLITFSLVGQPKRHYFY